MQSKNKAVHSPNQTFDINKPATKFERILHVLINKKMNRFQAQKIGCSVLNSTISTFRNTHGLKIESRPITIQGRFGTIHCNEYWVAGGGLEAAYKLLNHFRAKRGAIPLDIQKQAA